MSYQSINPFTGEIVQSFPYLPDNELEIKLGTAEQAFSKWHKTELQERRDLMVTTARLLLKKKTSLGELITAEMGKPITQSVAEIEKCALACQYFAEHGPDFLSPVELASSARKSLVFFEPTGTIFAVMPWNFPFWQVFRFLAPNLIAGNTCLLKHASNVPACALAIEELLLDAGAPEGVMQNLMIDHRQAGRVIEHPAVTGVTLTGSNLAGNMIAERAGRSGKKTVLELGGSDPYIVFKDADFEEAAKVGIMARFQNNGQSCIAAKRFLIQDTIFEQFVACFSEKVSKLKTGDPMDPETIIGPLARQDLMTELENQLHIMISHGAKVICGGKRLPQQNLIMEPAVITGLSPDDPVNRQELFGPVIPVFPFDSEEKAIALANQTPFGLGASVWTADKEKATRVARSIDTGTVAINGMVRSEPGLPFGGVKASGYGRELSVFGFREFLNIKTVNYY
jgi:succinate-semialdehyde dehydrogenase/glutarate-semialdehyde dehydrogenase